jgi:class 3 adenylate cyclase
LRLAFVDPEIEEAFRRYDDADSRPRRTVMCLLGGGFWMVFGLLDRELMSDASRFLPVRAAVTGIVIVSALVLWRDVARTAHETIACGVVLAFAWASDFGALTTDVPAYYVAGGNLMAALALFTLAGVRVRAAVVTGLLLIAGYVASAVVTADSWADEVTMIGLVAGGVCFGVSASWMLESLRRREYRLLHSILPGAVVTELRRHDGAIAEASDDVTVLFADIADFTPVAATLTASELVQLLDELFSEFDAICERHGVEKIKTIGDAYMAAAGVPRPDPDHAGSMATVALDMAAAAERFTEWPEPLELRIGMSSGPVVAGVIGCSKFAYDLWGDTVNTASRMNCHADRGDVVVSEETRRLLGDRFRFGPPRETHVKGKGVMRTYVLEGVATSARGAGIPQTSADRMHAAGLVMA